MYPLVFNLTVAVHCRNNVDDIGQIQYLSLCSKLQHLTLDGNPVCVTPTVDAEEVSVCSFTVLVFTVTRFAFFVCFLPSFMLSSSLSFSLSLCVCVCVSFFL